MLPRQRLSQRPRQPLGGEQLWVPNKAALASQARCQALVAPRGHPGHPLRCPFGSIQSFCSQVSLILLRKLEEPSPPLELSGPSQLSLGSCFGITALCAPGHRADDGYGAIRAPGVLLLPRVHSLCKGCTALTWFIARPERPPACLGGIVVVFSGSRSS